jgi:ABC-type transport system substrate-binding protein
MKNRTIVTLGRRITQFGYGAILGLVGLSVGVFMNHLDKKRQIRNQTIRLAISGPWITLHPGLQHTLWADVVLSNQFEALVGINEKGIVSPLGASSWTISKDFKTFTFTIDTKRKYSDGSSLKAVDYKLAWEEGLRLEPKSANSSLLDVASLLEGFETFSKSGVLSGVKVEGLGRLVLHFKRPFRLALTYLSGNRFAAFRQTTDNTFIGTGRYTIQEQPNGKLLLNPNPWFIDPARYGEGGQQNILLSTVPNTEMEMALKNSEIDAIAYSFGALIPKNVLQNSHYEIHPGPEAMHDVARINGNKNSIFSNRTHRIAFQYLLSKIIKDNQKRLGDPRLVGFDAQTFLPLQPGRLPQVEVDNLLSQGEAHIEDLITQSHKQPLLIYFRSHNSWIADELKQTGIVLSPKSRVIDSTETMALCYKSDQYDAIFAPFSVSYGDPDGIYHALGKNGAILCPVSYREPVGALLEEGRAIIGQEKLDAHYQNVSRSILQEVPFVHLGFSKLVAITKKDRVEVGDMTLRRNDGHLDVYRLK